MPLRRLLRLSGAVSSGLRRSLTTTASHPAWAMMGRATAAAGEQSADVRLAKPPEVSDVCVPEHLMKTRGSPGPDSDALQYFAGGVSAASCDGLLLLSYIDTRFTSPIVAKQGAARVRLHPTGLDPDHIPDVTRFVCSPLTRELSRLPDSVCDPLFAVAWLQGNQMLRFLSEKEEWETVPVSPCQLPSGRRMVIDQEALAFGGRLWWVDVTWGVISANPFSDRPELSFVELPRGSVLPEGAQDEAFRRGSPLPDPEGNVWLTHAPVRYRRVGVSEGRLRYVEVTQEEPFVLSSFALDEEGTGWTLEHRVVLSKSFRAGYMWVPYRKEGTTQIFHIDPFNANVVYLTLDELVVFGVDMDKKMPVGSRLYDGHAFCTCVLPPWLGSSRIPSSDPSLLSHPQIPAFPSPSSSASSSPSSPASGRRPPPVAVLPGAMLLCVDSFPASPWCPPRQSRRHERGCLLLLHELAARRRAEQSSVRGRQKGRRASFGPASYTCCGPARLQPVPCLCLKAEHPCRHGTARLLHGPMCAGPCQARLTGAGLVPGRAGPLARLSAAAVSGRLRRSLTTSATHPPWVMINGAAKVLTAPTAYVSLAEPPRVSNLSLPEHLLKIIPRPDPDGDVVQVIAGGLCALSGDGLLLIVQVDLRCLTKQGAGGTRTLIGRDPDQDPADVVTRFVFNPLTLQLSRIPDFVSDPVANIKFTRDTGILTQTDRGHGPPDRFVVASMQGHHMLRFLSETQEWEMVAFPRRVRTYFPSRYQLPVRRRMEVNQEALAFGGHLWWVDVTWGAVSVDPFSNRPELSFLELPEGSVLPPDEHEEALRGGRLPSDAEAHVSWTRAPVMYRRVGVSQGRLRYVEVSQDDPFLLRSFAFDKEGCGWTLEHRMVLNKLLADAGYLSLHLQTKGSARIVVIDPLNANVVHLEVVGQVVVVDMDREEEVTGSCVYTGGTAADCIPCVLPPWLGSSRIPSAGKKGVDKNKTLADVLVRSDNH
ncbi:unnamed protein product [Alopecurus aequalis]